MDHERVVIAEILRPRGNRGELLVISQTDVPGRMENLRSGQVRMSDGSDVRVEIEEAWQHKEHWVLKFAGVDSISAADRFRGSDLWIPLDNRGNLQDGEYFRSDLVGCSVIDGSDGTVLGIVEKWQQYGGPLLLEVSIAGREVLIPFVEPICSKVNLEDRTIVVELPEGLLDL